MFNTILREANRRASELLQAELAPHVSSETTVSMSLLNEHQVYLAFHYRNAEIDFNVYITNPTIEHAYFSTPGIGVESYDGGDFNKLLPNVQQLLDTLARDGALQAVDEYEKLWEEQ